MSSFGLPVRNADDEDVGIPGRGCGRRRELSWRCRSNRFGKSRSRIGVLILIESLTRTARVARVLLDNDAGRADETIMTPQGIIPTLQIMNGASTGRLYQLEREFT